MALNFSDWLEEHKEPQYQVEGKTPKCPEGLKWDSKLKTCVPKHQWTEGEKECPGSVDGYDVIGATGIDGDGYAVAVEEETLVEMTPLTYKERKRREEAEARHKEQDDRMRYGKPGKRRPDAGNLRYGEVKKFNKETGKWESNKQ